MSDSPQSADPAEPSPGDAPAIPVDAEASPMDIHKPKPVHGWREFASEILVVVTGILIALGLEQGVEAWHWRDEVRAGREHLRDEIAFDERVYAHRVDVAGCVRTNLAALRGVVADLRAGKRVGPIPEFTSPDNGPIQHEIWNSLSAAQVTVHFPKSELHQYSMFYQYREDAEYFMDRESRAWRQLHALEGDPNTLSRPELNALWVALGDAAESSDGLAYVAGLQVGIGRALGIAIPPRRAGQAECRPIVPAA